MRIGLLYCVAIPTVWEWHNNSTTVGIVIAGPHELPLLPDSSNIANR
jgi:hypothetical protein